MNPNEQVYIYNSFEILIGTLENFPLLFHVAKQIGWPGIARERPIKGDLGQADFVDFDGLRLATDLLRQVGLCPLATTSPSKSYCVQLITSEQCA